MNTCTSILKNIPCVIFNSLRTYATKLPEPIQYHGFQYYPRDENFKDPPYKPSKLFLVIRRKPLWGRNPMERKMLSVLNLDGEKKHNGHITIVKNIPEINAMLWKIKHLIEIKPIFWKGELPKDGDFSGTYLRETGEFVISPQLKVSPEIHEATEEHKKRNNMPRTRYMRKYLKKKWEFSMTRSP